MRAREGGVRLQRRRLRAASAQSLIENVRAKTTKTEKTAAEKIAINNTSEGASDAASYAFVGEQPEGQEKRRKEKRRVEVNLQRV